jgi:hypothetical protein
MAVQVLDATSVGDLWLYTICTAVRAPPAAASRIALAQALVDLRNCELLVDA